ncbi:MAG: rod shape-determining protein MreD, partial [Proteobacteria bacterium]|nr:rod shape-determining protein MreD [Pseudomonadota bacterium]
MGTRWWIPPLWLLGCAIVQGSLVPSLGVRQGRPDFVLQSVVIWAVTNGAREALGWALVGGICLDAVSGAPAGTATL